MREREPCALAARVKKKMKALFFCSNCANCANLFGFYILCEFCSDCANCVRIVRKVVLIFAHKKNRTKNKAMCGSFVRIFCSF